MAATGATGRRSALSLPRPRPLPRRRRCWKARRRTRAGSAAISLALAAGTFHDPQSEALTYTATLAHGQALPSWLKFNAATDSFTGTAPATAQTLAIEVTATDTSGLAASETFSVAVIAPPTLTTQTANQTWAEGSAFSLTLPASAFTDPQGETLTYAATLSNGQALPGWLRFNATTETFSGTAPVSAQTVNIKVTATDSSGLSASETFAATVQPGTTVRPGIAVTNQTPNQTWTDGSVVDFTLPANTFTDALGLKMSFAAYEVSGPDVTSWLRFNPTTDTLLGTVPASAKGTVELAVVATDSQHVTAMDLFSLTFAPSLPAHAGAIVTALGSLPQTQTSSLQAMLALPT
jgi:Putative Ig domain